MEKQLFLALAYFVRKRLAKRLLLAFQIGKKMSNVQNTLIFLFFSFLFHFFSSFSFSFSFLFPFSLLIRSAFPSFPLLSPYPIGISFLLSLSGGVQAITRAPTSGPLPSTFGPAPPPPAGGRCRCCAPPAAVVSTGASGASHRRRCSTRRRSAPSPPPWSPPAHQARHAAAGAPPATRLAPHPCRSVPRTAMELDTFGWG